MYSAWSTSWIAGIAAAVATAVGIAVEISTSSAPKVPPVWVMAAASLVVISLAGFVVALVGRGGLLIANCRHLALQSAISIPTIVLLAIGVLVTRPFESHAVLLDMKSGQSSSYTPPFAFWIATLGTILIPGVVSYVVGLLSRGGQVPPNKSLERTRDK
jgi:hypothetical protein